MTIERDLAAAIAANRFGLGARPGEIATAAADPQRFLHAQILSSGGDRPDDPNASTATRMHAFLLYRRDKIRDKAAGGARSDATKSDQRLLGKEEADDFLARARLAAMTPASFRERWALFWINHFTVSGQKKTTRLLVGPFETEAIRPRVFGRFEDMLVASSRHPAMLYYLDQARSIGPGSPAALAHGLSSKRAGLNENLAREIMELHTVGVETGYSQADVTEFARALTGWTLELGADSGAALGSFIFDEQAHEPGARSILGRTYAAGGEAQGRAVLADLAANPHTAHHLALKLARHFVADDPPPSLVETLRQSWLASGGRLDVVARALIDAPEAWDPTPRKFKTPYEFLISSWRTVGDSPTDARDLGATLTEMGQPPMRPPSPKGWPEEAQIWCAPDAIVKRMNWSTDFAQARTGAAEPMTLAANALGPLLTPAAAKSVARAETRAQGLAILLMSPEFQRR